MMAASGARAASHDARGRSIERGGRSSASSLVALIFGALVGPQFFAPANLELMARQTAIVCVAALGMTMVIVVRRHRSVGRLDRSR